MALSDMKVFNEYLKNAHPLFISSRVYQLNANSCAGPRLGVEVLGAHLFSRHEKTARRRL